MEPKAARQLPASSDVTRERILRGGIGLLSRKRYDAIRVDDLAKNAGVSRATYYRYYANKHECFAEIAQTLCAELRAWSDRVTAFDRGAAGFAELGGWVAAFADICERFGPILRVWLLPGVHDSPMGAMGREVSRELNTAMTARVARSPAGLPAVPGAGEPLYNLLGYLAHQNEGPRQPAVANAGLVSRLLYMAVFCDAPPVAANATAR